MDKFREPFSFSNHSLDDTLIDLGVRFVINCPPEDISTAVRLFFQLEEAHWFYEDFAREQNPDLPTFKLATFVTELYRAMPLMELVCAKPKTALHEFQQYKKNIPVRGGILVNEKLDKVLMVRSWKGSSWGFPRGKINKEEDDVVCAVREVLEETGYDMQSLIDPSEYIESSDNGKDIRLYIVSGVPEKTHFETQTRKEISRIAWIPVYKLPVFNKAINSSVSFYMVTPFMNGLKRYIGRKKGYATKLSSSETSALKNVLGITEEGGSVVHNDEDTAQHLLSMLRTSAPSKSPEPVTDGRNEVDSSSSSISAGSSVNTELKQDQEILLNLLKAGTPNSDKVEGTAQDTEQHDGRRAEVESAKEILNLLQSEIATEKTVSAPPTIQPLANQTDITTSPVQAPALPPNELLQSLVSSRRSNPTPKYTGTSPNEHRSTAPSKNSLLNLLNKPKGTESAKLMALLKPVKPPQPAPRTRRSALIDLLQDSDGSDLAKFDRPLWESPAAAAASDNSVAPQNSATSTIETEKTQDKETGPSAPTSQTEHPPPGRKPSSLLGLLQPQEAPKAKHAAPNTTSKLESAEPDPASSLIAEPQPEPQCRVGSALKQREDADEMQQRSKRHPSAAQIGNGATEAPKRPQSALLSLLSGPERSASPIADDSGKSRADDAMTVSSTKARNPQPQNLQSKCQTSPEALEVTRGPDALSKVSNEAAPSRASPSRPAASDGANDEAGQVTSTSALKQGETATASNAAEHLKPTGSSNPLLKLLDSSTHEYPTRQRSKEECDATQVPDSSKPSTQRKQLNSSARPDSSNDLGLTSRPESVQAEEPENEPTAAPARPASKLRNESQALMSLLTEKPTVQKDNAPPRNKQGDPRAPNNGNQKGSPRATGSQIHLLKLLNNTS